MATLPAGWHTCQYSHSRRRPCDHPDESHDECQQANDNRPPKRKIRGIVCAPLNVKRLCWEDAHGKFWKTYHDGNRDHAGDDHGHQEGGDADQSAFYIRHTIITFSSEVSWRIVRLAKCAPPSSSKSLADAAASLWSFLSFMSGASRRHAPEPK